MKMELPLIAMQKLLWHFSRGFTRSRCAFRDSLRVNALLAGVGSICAHSAHVRRGLLKTRHPGGQPQGLRRAGNQSFVKH